MTPQQIAELTRNSHVRQMLDVIAQAEGVKHGYNTMFGNSRIEDLSDHPRQLRDFTQTDGQKNKTSAAGRYQFLQGTWDDVASKLGLQDFGPQSQDMAAVELLRRNGALDDVLKGDLRTALQKSGGTWASLPSSPYAQPKRDEGFMSAALDRAAQAVFPAAHAQSGADISDRIAAARAAGYSDEEIQAYIASKGPESTQARQTQPAGGNVPADLSQRVERAKAAGYSDEEIQAYVRAREEQGAPLGRTESGQPYLPLNQQNTHAPAPQPAPEQPGIASQIARQAGLTLRAGAQGLGDIVGIGSEPIRQLVVNPVADMLGLPRAASVQNTVEAAADTIGLPTPQNATERVANEAARFMAGAGGLAGGANRAAQGATGVTKAALEGLGAAPLLQVMSGAGAGAAGGAAREAGASPGSQLAASVIGGVMAPVAVNRATSIAQGTARRAGGVTDAKVTEAVNSALRQAGVAPGSVPDRAINSLKAEARQALRVGRELDPKAVARLADFRSIDGMIPTRANITLDPIDITQTKNLAKIGANSQNKSLQALAQAENTNNRALIDAMNRLGADSATDPIQASEYLVQTLRAQDVPRKAVVDAAYQAVRAGNGQTARMSSAQFSNLANNALDEGSLGYFLPSEARAILDDFTTGKVPLDVRSAQVAESVLGGLAEDMKRQGKGRHQAATLAVRRALQNTPIEGDAGREAMRAYEQAKRLAAQRLKINEAPGIEAALIDEAPDKFIQKYIIGSGGGANARDVVRLSRELRKNPAAFEVARAQIFSHLKNRALSGKADEVGNFSSSNFNKALDSIGITKLRAFMTKDEIDQLNAIRRVSANIDFQPRGSGVNNSNSGALVAGRALDMLANLSQKFSGLKLFGIGPTLQAGGQVLQARQGMNLGEGISRAIERPSFSARLAPRTIGGGLLPLAAQAGNDEERN